jgi:peptide methionine sulfoxide reductase MsrB
VPGQVAFTLPGAHRSALPAARGGQIGHVIADGPASTGNRLCMNGAALHSIPAV